MQNKIITSFFCLLLAVSALIGLLMPDRYYSEREKRTLTQKPKFTVADFISGEFSDELEKYLTDQVPLRDNSFFAENMKIETDVSDAEREAYTHRIPDSNGSSYTDRESNVSTRKCTATVSVTIQPQTVLGDAIYAAGGFGGGMTIESNAVELKDATVEGGASSW